MSREYISKGKRCCFDHSDTKPVKQYTVRGLHLKKDIVRKNSPLPPKKLRRKRYIKQSRLELNTYSKSIVASSVSISDTLSQMCKVYVISIGEYVKTYINPKKEVTAYDQRTVVVFGDLGHLQCGPRLPGLLIGSTYRGNQAAHRWPMEDSATHWPTM